MTSQTPDRDSRWTDDDVEQLVGNWLRIGTLIAAVITVLGGALFLAGHSSAAAANYHQFNGEPDALRHVTNIVAGAFHLDSRAVIQLGLLLLISTPVVRVALSLMAFIVQRDKLYVALTSIVLAILVFSLVFGGHA